MGRKADPAEIANVETNSDDEDAAENRRLTSKGSPPEALRVHERVVGIVCALDQRQPVAAIVKQFCCLTVIDTDPANLSYS